MNISIFPELFYLISINLNDKEKVLFVSHSKITYNFKSLVILDSEYEINDKYRAKNIIINDFALENLIPESITAYSKYIKFISNNTNIKLFLNEKIIEKIISYGCYYLARKTIEPYELKQRWNSIPYKERSNNKGLEYISAVCKFLPRIVVDTACIMYKTLYDIKQIIIRGHNYKMYNGRMCI